MDMLRERLQLARQKKMSLQEAMLVILRDVRDEVERRESNAVTMRALKAQLEPELRLEAGTRRRLSCTAGERAGDGALLEDLRIPANVNTQIGERERSGATLSMCHELGLESSFRREGPFSTMR